MKKALSLVLVLAIASAASAIPTAAFLSGGLDYVEVNPGDVITVELVYTGDAGFMTIVCVVDTASTQGIVSDALVNTDFDWPLFYGIVATNGSDFLIESATGKTQMGSPDVTGTLLSFDYEVSALLPLNEEFEIGATGFVEIGGGGVTEISDPADIGSLTLKVVPEPATMLLLAIGGMLLRRRK